TPPLTGRPQARLVAADLAREQGENEKARRDRAALPIDRVEVARAAEPVLAVHRPTLRREALPALCSAPLENRAAGTRRHARTKTVPALTAAHVGLVGPLQGKCKEGEKSVTRRLAAAQYRRALSTELSTARLREMQRKGPARMRVSTPVEGCVDLANRL